MTNFRINVVSDTVCPWCYVGRRQLQLAQQLWQRQNPTSNDTFSITYAPYQLQPQWPRGPGSSIDKHQFYIDRFGEGRTTMMRERLRAVGDNLGIGFKFGGRTGNTRDSHRLVHLAKNYGNEVELKTVDGLFAAYFENERDITDYEVLRAVAVDAGIPEAEFRKAIVESDAGGEQVDLDAGKARNSGISGVPNYTIQDAYQLSGAGDPMEFIGVFEKIKALEQQ